MKLRTVREDRKPRRGSGVPWVPRQSCGQVGGGTSEPPGATRLKLKQSFLFLLNRNCLRESVASGAPSSPTLGFFLKSPSSSPAYLLSFSVWAGTIECWGQADSSRRQPGTEASNVQKEALSGLREVSILPGSQDRMLSPLSLSPVHHGNFHRPGLG